MERSPAQHDRARGTRRGPWRPRGFTQSSANAATSILPIPSVGISVPIGTGIYTYQFCSGPRAAGAPQPLQFRGTRVEAGYSIAIGTGYNASGYAFHSYQINATGSGPRNAQREIETLAEYGPVAQ